MKGKYGRFNMPVSGNSHSPAIPCPNVKKTNLCSRQAVRSKQCIRDVLSVGPKQYDLPTLEEKYQMIVRKYDARVALQNQLNVDDNPKEEEKLSDAIERCRIKKAQLRHLIMTFCQENKVQSKVLDNEGIKAYKYLGTSSEHLNELVSHLLNARITPDLQLLERMVREAINKEGWEETPELLAELINNLMEDMHTLVEQIRMLPSQSFLMNALAELDHGDEVDLSIQKHFKSTIEDSRQRWDEAFLGFSNSIASETPTRKDTAEVATPKKKISFTPGKLTTVLGEPLTEGQSSNRTFTRPHGFPTFAIPPESHSKSYSTNGEVGCTSGNSNVSLNSSASRRISLTSLSTKDSQLKTTLGSNLPSTVKKASKSRTTKQSRVKLACPFLVLDSSKGKRGKFHLPKI